MGNEFVKNNREYLEDKYDDSIFLITPTGDDRGSPRGLSSLSPDADRRDLPGRGGGAKGAPIERTVLRPRTYNKKSENERSPSNNGKRDKYVKINRHKLFGRRKVQIIKIIYLIGIVLWTILIWYMKFYKTGKLGYIILIIPLFVYLFGFINSNKITVEVEDSLFSANYLSVGLLIVVPLLSWVDSKEKENKNKVMVIESMLIAIVLSLLSLVDIWVSPKWLSTVKHIKSILQTAAVTLLVFSLYMFYEGRRSKTDTTSEKSEISI